MSRRGRKKKLGKETPQPNNELEEFGKKKKEA